jgi:hypothetical protein
VEVEEEADYWVQSKEGVVVAAAVEEGLWMQSKEVVAVAVAVVVEGGLWMLFKVRQFNA